VELKLTYLKQCPVCTCEFTTDHPERRTCSSPCARVLRSADWWFYDDEYAETRLSLARSILQYPEDHRSSQVRWASKLMSFYLQTGHVVAPKYRFLQPHSKARRVMEEVLGPERVAEIISVATRETVEKP
jgi:hypothetical protein